MVPFRLETKRFRKREPRKRKPKSKLAMKKKKYQRLNIDEFTNKYRSVFSPVVLEIMKMDLMKRKMKKPKYSQVQRWLGVNFLVAASKAGYGLLSKLLPLPSEKTSYRLLKKFKTDPGLNHHNTKLMRLKVNLSEKNSNLVFLLFDEMSLRSSLAYHQPSDTIYGFSNDGNNNNRCKELVSSVLCVMAVGIVKKWKYPLCYFLTSKTMKSDQIANIVKDCIKAMEDEGFHVLGLTSDQGPNFQKAFRLLGATENNPKISIDDKWYFVICDPPHLLRSSRNYLLNGDVKVPGTKASAKWSHICQLHSLDSKNSFKLAPRLTEKHIYDLNRSSKMKVKYAAQCLSNSVSAAMNFCIANQSIPTEAVATSEYLKKINDVFDAMNSSSPLDKVKLRRPLYTASESVDFLLDMLKWLTELETLNKSRRCHFIRGWRQNINAIIELNQKLNSLGIPYLATRNLCQDSLELFFGKVRRLSKYPDSLGFANNYSKIASASLIAAPSSGNCEADIHEVIEDVMVHENFVSFIANLLVFNIIAGVFHADGSWVLFLIQLQ